MVRTSVLKYSNNHCDRNNDCTMSETLSDSSSIYIVTNGVDGCDFGNMIAKDVANFIMDFSLLYHQNYSHYKLLKQSLHFANETLQAKRQIISSKKIGCSVVVMIIDGGYTYFSWIGDCRFYFFRDGEIVFKSHEHVIDGKVSISIAGERKFTVPNLFKLSVKNGDVLILCSRGFYKNFDIDVAFRYDIQQKHELDSMSNLVSENYSFIKVEL